MARFARAVIAGCPHHVTQRGNQCRDIFFTERDREVYLGLLKQYVEIYEVGVLGYCLMTNHVHLVLVPPEEDSLAKLFREVNMRYAQYRNAIEGGYGHLWQGRYYSCAFESVRLGPVMRYVELNPVRAGLTRWPEAYAWSSAAAHVGGADRWEILTMEGWRRSWAPEEWAEVLAVGKDHSSQIRKATHGGRPFGSDEFIAEAEKLLGRRLKEGVRGRRKKTGAAVATAQGLENGEISVCP